MFDFFLTIELDLLFTGQLGYTWIKKTIEQNMIRFFLYIEINSDDVTIDFDQNIDYYHCDDDDQ